MYLVTYENQKFHINFISKINFDNNYDLISAVKFPGGIKNIFSKIEDCENHIFIEFLLISPILQKLNGK